MPQPSGHFNPRSLTGATEPFRAYNLIYNISIHAPSRERPFFFRRCCSCVTFQSTLPHGSDNGAKYKIPRYYHFNPRSLTGATSLAVQPVYVLPHFNPRSLTGATVSGSDREALNSDFNPRSLTGATCSNEYKRYHQTNFNPRSLTGATIALAT